MLDVHLQALLFLGTSFPFAGSVVEERWHLLCREAQVRFAHLQQAGEQGRQGRRRLRLERL
jgi:hypothetical protein